MGEIVVQLSTPLDIGGNEKVNRVVLREPRMRELLTFGKPFRWVVVAGTPQLVEDDDAIKAYIERLLVTPDISSLLGNLSLSDGLAVRAAFLDFFAKSERSVTERTATSSD